MLCQICNGAYALNEIGSIVGGTRVCVECFEARAETPITIHEAYQTLARMMPGSRKYWEYRELLRPVTCFDGFDFGYVPHIRYLEIKAKQLPVVSPTNEMQAYEEAESQRLVAMMVAVRDGIESRQTRPARRSWVGVLFSWLFGAGALPA